MWPDDGQEMWERDGYAEAMYEKADNDRKALKENGEANSAKSTEIRKGKDGASLFDALRASLELTDLRRNGTTLGEEFPESRALIAAALDAVENAPEGLVAWVKTNPPEVVAARLRELDDALGEMLDAERDRDLRELTNLASCSSPGAHEAPASGGR